MLIVAMLPVYIALWLLAVHIQYLMRNENKQDKMWIYPVYSMIAISFAALMAIVLR